MYVDHVYQTALITVVSRVLFLQPLTLHFRDCNSYIGIGIYGGNREKGKHSEL